MIRAGTFRFALGLVLMAGSAAFAISSQFGAGRAVDERLEHYAHCDRMRVASLSGEFILAELALAADDQERGLQDRADLDVDGGMIFIFPEPVQPNFWMRGVAFPLDLIFIAPGGVVLDVHRSADPGSEELITPSGPVLAVVETVPGRFTGLAPETQLGFDCVQDHASWASSAT